MIISYKEDGVDASIQLRVVSHLGVLTPYHLTSLSNQSQFGDIDLNYSSCVRKGIPLVITPREVYNPDWGFFFTPRILSLNVVFNYG